MCRNPIARIYSALRYISPLRDLKSITFKRIFSYRNMSGIFLQLLNTYVELYIYEMEIFNKKNGITTTWIAEIFGIKLYPLLQGYTLYILG